MKTELDAIIQTIEQLVSKPMPINKAHSLGIIIDSSGTYFDQHKNHYCKKIKLIDQTYNSLLSLQSLPNASCPYLTVFFQSSNPNSLPDPKTLGDIMYLKRFKFKMHKRQLQAFNYQGNTCSWYLIEGSLEQYRLNIYQSSKKSCQVKQRELQNLIETTKSLLNFSYKFLKQQSIVSLLPSGVLTRDKDIIVKVVGKIPQGYILQKGSAQIFLPYLPSLVSPPCLAKLRSIAQFRNTQKRKEVVCNNYTSLTQIFDWTYDAKKYQIDNEYFNQQQLNVYTDLSFFNTVPLSITRDRAIKRNYFNIKVQIADIYPQQFVQAIQYYSHLSDTTFKYEQLKEQFQQIEVIYNMTFVCMDKLFHKNQTFYEIQLFSVNGKGGDLIPRVNLKQIGAFTSFVQQQQFFKKRLDQLLGARWVRMKIEVLADLNDNRIFRLIEILQIN